MRKRVYCIQQITKATTLQMLLFFVLIFLYQLSFSQDTLPVLVTNNTDSIQKIKQDTFPFISEPEDTLNISDDFFIVNKKEIRAEKTKKAFKFMSYFNYNDRGYGKDFSGIEK